MQLPCKVVPLVFRNDKKKVCTLLVQVRFFFVRFVCGRPCEFGGLLDSAMEMQTDSSVLADGEIEALTPGEHAGDSP